MTDWLIWTRGLRALQPAVLFARGEKAPSLSKFEQDRLVGTARPLKDGEGELPLDELVRRYPPPPVIEEA